MHLYSSILSQCFGPLVSTRSAHLEMQNSSTSIRLVGIHEVQCSSLAIGLYFTSGHWHSNTWMCFWMLRFILLLKGEPPPQAQVFRDPGFSALLLTLSLTSLGRNVICTAISHVGQKVLTGTSSSHMLCGKRNSLFCFLVAATTSCFGNQIFISLPKVTKGLLTTSLLNALLASGSWCPGFQTLFSRFCVFLC